MLHHQLWETFFGGKVSNGPDDVKSPCGLAAGLLLLSEVGAEAATLCCQKEAASLSNNAWFVG
jgi:hypothetical protein